MVDGGLIRISGGTVMIYYGSGTKWAGICMRILAGIDGNIIRVVNVNIMGVNQQYEDTDGITQAS